MTLKYEIEQARGGTCAKLKVSGGQARGGLRKEIKGLSAASRKRLMDFFNQLPRAYRQNALYLTLTYPGEYPSGWGDWKRDLDVFSKRLLRLYPQAAFVWKLELQKRGAPHFHLMAWGVKFMHFRWLAETWYEVVGSGDKRHLLAGTQVVRLKNDKMAMFYLCKYMSKVDEIGDLPYTGRAWGVRGRCNLPVCVYNAFLEPVIFYEVRRVVRGWLERKIGRRVFWARRGGEGITAYLDEQQVEKIIQCARAKFA